MAGFIAGAFTATIILLGCAVIYSLSQIAGAYDRSVDRWFDDFED